MIGLIRTPSSRWAFVASSASFPASTFFPHRVFTNVVRPGAISQLSRKVSQVSSDIPVPEAPQTIKQNWIPFLTFFFLRILICEEADISTGSAACRSAENKPQHGTARQRCGQNRQKGVARRGCQHTALNGEDILVYVRSRGATASQSSRVIVMGIKKVRS